MGGYSTMIMGKTWDHRDHRHRTIIGKTTHLLYLHYSVHWSKQSSESLYYLPLGFEEETRLGQHLGAMRIDMEVSNHGKVGKFKKCWPLQELSKSTMVTWGSFTLRHTDRIVCITLGAYSETSPSFAIFYYCRKSHSWIMSFRFQRNTIGIWDVKVIWWRSNWWDRLLTLWEIHTHLWWLIFTIPPFAHCWLRFRYLQVNSLVLSHYFLLH